MLDSLHQRDRHPEVKNLHLISLLLTKPIQKHCKNHFLANYDSKRDLNEHQLLLEILVMKELFFWMPLAPFIIIYFILYAILDIKSISKIISLLLFLLGSLVYHL